jgi:hypothetical protein
MLKGEGFGPHGEKYGHRLGKQIAAGPAGLARRFVEIEQQGRVVGTVFGPDAEREFVRRAQDEAAGADRGGPTKTPLIARAAARPPPGARVAEAGANDNRPRGKRGPAPAAGPRPWEVEGMSRASWFRRKKGGGG